MIQRPASGAARIIPSLALVAVSFLGGLGFLVVWHYHPTAQFAHYSEYTSHTCMHSNQERVTGREAYLHSPSQPPCPRLHRLLPLENPCSAPHSPRLPRPSRLPAKRFEVSRDRRQRTCAPHANQRRRTSICQPLPPQRNHPRAQALTHRPTLTLFLTHWRRASSSHLLFVVILLGF